MGEVAKLNNGKDYKHLGDGNIPVYGTGGYMLSVNQALSYKDDAIGIGRKGTIDKPYILKAPFWTVDTLFYSIPNDKTELNFLFATFQKVDWKAADESTGVPSLSKSTIENIITFFPSLPEQARIGAFFCHLDRLITLHQCNCNMATRPCEWSSGLRAIAWEQRKLGEIGKAYSGVGFPDNEQGRTEGIPFFKVSDMNSIGNENELQNANNYVDIFQISRHKWKPITEVPAIFFAKVGAAVMLNRKRLVQYPFLLDNNTMAYSFEKGIWNISFGKSLFETIDLTSLVQVGALPSYNASDVEDIKIFLPSLPEQARIGTFFRQLDRLITLHQRKHILLT